MSERTKFYTSFDVNSPDHRTVPAWRQADAGGNWRIGAKRHAARFGEARVLRADGRVIRFWREGQGIRQRTYTNVHFDR